MPGKVKVRIAAGRSLPVMDRSNDTTDAYVEVKLGQITYKTDVCRKSLNPQWNSEWFKFEMDDLELQDEPLQIRVMDYDTYSANDAIGKVYLDLSPLLISQAKEPLGKTISGWIPIFDTMHGLRGEINVTVKVELFSDLNKYRQSSCGVRFFFSPHIPEGFVAHSINGFVEELLINDDPEYQWIDKIRTPRASNEARQTLFQKLSGEVQRKVGLKALELGANAVVGYKQYIDLEGDSGLVIRGIGTAVYLTKLYESQLSPIPLGSGCADGTAKESHLYSQHSLPRKRTSPRPHRSSRNSSPLNLPPTNASSSFPSTIAMSAASKYEREEKLTVVIDKRSQSPLCSHSKTPVKLNPSSSNLTTACSSQTHVPAQKDTSSDCITKPKLDSETSQSSSEKLDFGLPLKLDISSQWGKMDLEFIAADTLSEISEERASQDSRPSSVPPLPSVPSYQMKNKLASLPPASLSEKESDCSFSEDSPPTSPNSTTGSVKFSLLNLRRKHRWLTKRDRWSTNCLVKRASSGPGLKSDSSSSSTSKLKEEFGKFMKRISFGDNNSDPDTEGAKGPYRQPRRLFFRKRRRNSRSFRFSSSHKKGIIRSNSECESHSLSLRQTSSESLPSVGSEPPVFSLPDDDDEGGLMNSTSLLDIPTFLQLEKEINIKPKPTRDELQKPVPTTVPVDRSKLCELIGDLGYDITKPLRLYISSLDALLVYDPSRDMVNTSCVCLNVDHNNQCALNSAPEQVDLDPPNKEKLDRLLSTSGSGSSKENSIDQILDKGGIKKRRHRSGTLVACNSSTTSSTTSSSTSSSSKGLMNLHMTRKLKMKRTDDEQVQDLELEHSFEQFETLVKKAHESVKNSGSGGVISLPTGCRSPIPEEFVESSHCGTPVTNVQELTNILHAQLSSSPPVQHPVNGNSTTDNHRDNDPNNHVIGSPDKDKGTKVLSCTPGKGHYQMHRRSSESDLSTTPKGTASMFKIHRPLGINAESLQLQEFPFITMSSRFPEPFIQYLGGTVTARSVKLLKSIGNFEEPNPETRDSWWNELRIEMRSHLRSFGCNVILDYDEQSTVWDEVAILSASGTAAIMSGTSTDVADGGGDAAVSTREHNVHKRAESFSTTVTSNTTTNGLRTSPKPSRRHNDSEGNDIPPCSMLHIPQTNLSLPTIIKKTRCAYCKQGKVPDILLATIELPSNLPVAGRSCLIQTQIFRPKREGRGDTGAKDMSDSLPFLEYELHRRLINKLKIKGMNSVFGLKVQIIQGDKVVIGIATGTAVFLTALPVPTIPSICAGNHKTDAQKVTQFQKVLQESFEKNREIFGLKNISVPNDVATAPMGSNANAESDDDLDVESDTKDIFVLEVDDAEDIDIISMLIDPSVPVGYNMGNIEHLVGFNNYRVVSQQMFTQLWRCKMPTISQRQLNSYFDRLLRAVSFKLRRMQPYALSKMLWNISLPEADELQLCVIGMALGLDKKPSQTSSVPSKSTSVVEAAKTDDDHEMIFPFDEDKEKDKLLQPQSTSSHNSSVENLAPGSNITPPLSASTNKSSVPSSPVPSATSISVNVGQGSQQTLSNANIPTPVSKMRSWVEVTPLSFIPGAKIERYLGNLNFYFIRETSGLRECGGIDAFTHALFTDILAIVRAHVSALGGNAIVSYFMNKNDMSHNQHKNQWQCVVNVGGDAVFVSYPVGSHPEDGIHLLKDS